MLAWGLILVGVGVALWQTGALDRLLGGDDVQPQEQAQDTTSPEISREIDETVSRRVARRTSILEGDLEGLRESIMGRFSAI